MSTEERTITIVDDIMGSGKSTWAINYINDNPDSSLTPTRWPELHCRFAVFFFFKCDCNISIRRKTHFIAFNIGNKPQ